MNLKFPQIIQKKKNTNLKMFYIFRTTKYRNTQFSKQINGSDVIFFFTNVIQYKLGKKFKLSLRLFYIMYQDRIRCGNK
jgi:hypothetical protein